MGNAQLTKEQHNQLSHTVADAAMQMVGVTLAIGGGHACVGCVGNEALNVLIGAVESLARAVGDDETPHYALMSSVAAQLALAATQLESEHKSAGAVALAEATKIIGGR